MTKHYILSINPDAQYQWDQCTLRDSLTAEHPDFPSLIADAVGNERGSYLVAVNIEVQVLEKADTVQPRKVPLNSQHSQLVA